MAFEHGSTCVLTPIRDPFNQDLLGFDVYDKLDDCPEVRSGWTRIEFLVVDGQISPWFTGPDGDYWRIYSTEEYLGENFETPEVVQYASEMDCKYGNSDANYKATWYFSSIDYLSIYFEDDRGNICPLIVDNNAKGQIEGVFVIDSWNTCNLVKQGFTYIKIYHNSDNTDSYLGPEGQKVTFFDRLSDINYPDYCKEEESFF